MDYAKLYAILGGLSSKGNIIADILANATEGFIETYREKLAARATADIHEILNALLVKKLPTDD